MNKQAIASSIWLILLLAISSKCEAIVIEYISGQGDHVQSETYERSDVVPGPHGTFFGPDSDNIGIIQFFPNGDGTYRRGAAFEVNAMINGGGNVSHLTYKDGKLFGAVPGDATLNISNQIFVINGDGTGEIDADVDGQSGNIAITGTSEGLAGFYTTLSHVLGNSNNVEFVSIDLSAANLDSVVKVNLGGISVPKGLFCVPPPGVVTPNSRQLAGKKLSTVTSNDLSGYVLYGTAQFGGSANFGAIYRVNGDGSGFQILHSFSNSSSDGKWPKGGVILSSDGSTLYGTTSAGGANFSGCVYSISTNGSNFTLLAAPQAPEGELLLVGDTLYGTSFLGGNYQTFTGVSFGTSANGAVYSVKTNGTGFLTLYSFPPLSTGTNSAGLRTNIAGANPAAGLVWATNALIGSTSTGGANGFGTLFSLPFAPPTITVNPSNQWESFGDFLDLHVETDGIGPVGYQWQFNGANQDGQIYNPYFNLLTSSDQLGGYSVIVTNAYGSVTSSVATVSLSILQNDSFEAGNFNGWTLSNGANQSLVQSGHDPGYAGSHAAFLGENTTSLNYLSQTLTTVVGQTYLVSFWLNTSGIAPANEFLVSWNGTTLFDQTNLPIGTNPSAASSSPANGWMNMQFTVIATNTSTVLQFGFQTGSSAKQFVLDDVRIAPTLISFGLQAATLSAQSLVFNWSSIANAKYQVQFTSSLTPANWVNVGGPVTANTNTVSVNYPATAQQGYYRVLFSSTGNF